MKKVKTIGGVPQLFCDGEIMPPVAYMSYLTDRAAYGSFSRAGFKLFCVLVQASEFAANEESCVCGGFSPQTWLAPNRFDFSSLDSDLQKIVSETGNENVRVILRVNLNMPKWWREKYPQELTKFDHGKTLMQSVFSARWKKDGARYLAALKKHLEESRFNKNVIAWQPAAMHTEEWIAPQIAGACDDFSAPAARAFRAYCRKKYKTVCALNAAWGAEYRNFYEITIPSAAERAEQKTENENAREIGPISARARDYFAFYNDGYAHAAEYFCKKIKELYRGDIFTGCFSGYIAQLDRRLGHCAVSRLLNSKNIDFFASPFAYSDNRAPAIDWAYHAPTESAKRAGKLWFLEADVRTSLTILLTEAAPRLFSPERAGEAKRAYGTHPVWIGPDEKNSEYNILRSFAKTFISRNAFWWFDMFGGWYENEEYMRLIAATRSLYEKELKNRIKSASEIAVILDETSSYYASMDTFYSAVYEQLLQLGYVGAPYDLLLLNDLKKTVKSKNGGGSTEYKAYIFLAPAPVRQTQKLAETLIKNGKTVIVTGDEAGVYAKMLENRASVEFANVNGSFAKRKNISTDVVIQSLLRANVHLYSAGNIVYANGKYIAVTARKTGNVSIRMRKSAVLVDCLNKERLYLTEKTCTIFMQKNECRLFEIESAVQRTAKSKKEENNREN